MGGGRREGGGGIPKEYREPGGGNPGVKGAGSLWEVGEERAGVGFSWCRGG